jgi:hypothetical protein
MFRNESEAVIGKAKAKKSMAKAKSSSSTPRPQPTEFHDEVLRNDPASLGHDVTELTRLDPAKYSDWSIEAAMTPTYIMTPTLEERGSQFFNTHSHVWFKDFDIVESICSQTKRDDHLITSMSALGLASFANSIHAPELMNRARREYVTALRLTNAALKSPTEVQKDSTLFAVMILSIYETVSGTNERSLGAWTEHVNGAAALVKLRGMDQFKTLAGQRMFLQVTSNLMVSCVQRTIAMPSHMIELRDEAAKWMDTSSPAWPLSGIIIDYTIFRAKVRECKIVGPRKIVEGALDIDRRFMDILDKLPPSWKFETKYTDENPELVWNGRYHVYTDFWMAQAWNGLRVYRILLHEAICDQILVASEALTPIFTEEEASTLFERSTKTLLEMQGDILASVPHHMPTIVSNRPSSLLEGSRAYFILWPLYLAAAMDMTTEEIQRWVAGRLRAIGESVGILHATLLADLVESKTHIKIWERKPRPRLENIEPDTWHGVIDIERVSAV